MSPNHRGALVALLFAIVLSSANIGCGGSSPAIQVLIPGSTATVDVGTTAQFTATVANDSSNGGINWRVSCSAPRCGSVLPTSTPSGVPTTYTPPAAQGIGLTVTLSATSVKDATKSASVTITVPAVTVALSKTTDTVQPGATSQYSATVANDGANGGVNWTVSCSQAACGSVSPAFTASGDTTTYSAPTAPPAGNLQVTLTATSATDSAVLTSAAITVPGIVITLSPTSAAVPSGGTQPFSATVTGDPNGSGVNWSMVYLRQTCNPFTRRCGPPYSIVACTTCGTVAPSSGGAVTYTAPAAFTPPFLVFRGAFLQATSATNASAITRAAITILPISVSVSPSPASVALKGTQTFTATVNNDGSNSGVTWTLTQNGSKCSPECGTIPSSSPSDAPVTYTAPTNAPPLPLVTVTATSVEDSRKAASVTVTLTTATGLLACGAGSASESLLNGQYAFALSGTDSTGFAGAAGSITASGTGNITAGDLDVTSTGAYLSNIGINASGNAYAVGPDHRGCMVLTNANGGTSAFRFALTSINGSGVATAGHILEFDDTTGSGTRLSGMLRLQDSTSFAASQFKGNYAFGVVGLTGSRFGMAGTFAADGVSALSSGTFDFNEGGAVTSNFSATPAGSFTCCTTNGRGTLTLQAYTTPTFTFYMVSSNSAILISGPPAVVGELHVIPSGTSFTQSSLNGMAVLRATGQAAAGPVVDLALASADGSGNITTNDNINAAGSFSSSSANFTYNVAATGRVSLTGGSTPPVLYLYGPNQGYLLGTDANVTFGILDPQAAGPFSKASFSGAYAFGSEYPSANTVTLESGVLAANGTGTASGLADQSNSIALTQNQNLNFIYSIAANGTGNVGTGTTAIVISTDKLVFIKNTDPNPTITVVEK